MPFKKMGTGAKRPKHKSKVQHIPHPEQSKHEFEKAEHHSKHHLEHYNPSLKVMLLGHH